MFVNEAECLVLKRKLEWIVTLERYNAILEMDCKLVIDDINKNKLNLSEYDMILQDCKTFLSHHNNYKVVFTRRQENGSTHALAWAFYLMLITMFLI
jgi:ribonuclease HI